MAVMPIHRLFFSLLLVFLPTQLGFHFWPEWAGVLGRRVDYLSPTIYFTDVLIFLALASWIINSRKKFSIKQRNFKLLFFILGFAILNIFFAQNQPVAIYKWLKVLEFGLLGFYIYKTKPALSFIIYHLSFGILYSSLLAIAQFALQHSVGGPLWWLGERTFTLDTPGIARVDTQFLIFNFQFSIFRLRPYATFPHPNVLGGFLAATIPLLIFNFQFSIFNQTKKFSIFKLATIILGTIALVLTGSRSAIVVGAIAFVIGIMKSESRIMNYELWKKNKFIIQHSLFVILFLILAWTFLKINPADESVVVRQQLNAAAIKLWQQSPLIGVGLGNFLVELPKALTSRTIYFLQPVHNIYLLVLSETGVVGLVLFLLLIGKGIRGLVLGIREKKKQFFIFHFSFFILLLLGLVDHYPLTLQQGQLLFTLLFATAISNKT